jgi:hypothetical protein
MTRVMWLPSHQVLFSFSFTKVTTYVALVGVCVSMVSNFYQLHFTQRNLCCINKSTMKHQQISDSLSDLWFSYGRWKQMLVVPLK